VGSGYKNFNAGDVLTADQVDGYLMRQAVMTFASTAARDAALSGVLDEGMVTFQEDTDSITFYTGAAWRTLYRGLTAYTPTGAGVLTVGNGSFGAAWMQHGDEVTFSGILTLGTTSAIGSGLIQMSLPVAANSLYAAFGQAWFYDVSTNQYFPAMGQVFGAVFTINRFLVSTGAAVSSTAPFTWTTSDQIGWTISYFAN
jgi:hypothetical protein